MMSEPHQQVQETCGPVPVVRHHIATPDGAELALTRVEADGTGPPVIMVHGNFSHRGFWISDKGLGLGPHLAEAGFDVWIVELRGHGYSPKPPDFPRIGIETHAFRDLPAVARYVRRQNEHAPWWVGHSAGGLYLTEGLAARVLDRDTVAGAILLGAQMEGGNPWMRLPGINLSVRLLLRMMGTLPSPRLGLGPEVEPAQEMIDRLKIISRFGRWRTPTGDDVYAALRDLHQPLLAIAGAADTDDPAWGCKLIYDAWGSADREFLELGTASGFSRDYGHVDMVVSKAAQREVWPRIADWLRSRT